MSLTFSLCDSVCFQGEIMELKVVGNPQAAERLCDDEDDSDAVSVCVNTWVQVSAAVWRLSLSLRPLETLAVVTVTEDGWDTQRSAAFTVLNISTMMHSTAVKYC